MPDAERRLWPYLLVGLLVAAVAGGATWYSFGSADIADGGHGPVAAVTRGPLVITVAGQGEVRPEKQTAIANEIRYPVIIKSLVDEGTRVERGQTVITFECRELLDEIETKRIAVTNARNTHLQAMENVELEKKEVANEIRKAEQAVVDANADLTRYIEAGGQVKIADANSAIGTAKRDLALSKDKLDFKLKVNADPELNSPFSENEIEAEKLSVEKLQIALDKAVSNYEMLQKYDHPREIEKLKIAVEDAVLALARAEHNARSKILTAETDRDTKKVTLDMQEKYLLELEDDANRLVVTAEEEGLVVYDTGSRHRFGGSDVTVEVGAKISPRQQLMIIPDMTTLMVRTSVYEARIKQVRVGQKASITLDSEPGKPLSGTVSKVSVLPDSQNPWASTGVKAYKVYVAFDEGTNLRELKPGLSLNVDIVLDRLENVLSVPIAAVFTKQAKTYCYVLEGGEPVAKEVKVGRMNDTRVQILSGLDEKQDKVLLVAPTSEKRDAKKDEDSDEGDRPKSPARGGGGGAQEKPGGARPAGARPGGAGPGR